MNLVQSDIKSLSDQSIRKAFSVFLERSAADRAKAIKRFKDQAFTSFIDTEAYTSLVLSDYTALEKIPKEFQEFMHSQWADVKTNILRSEFDFHNSLTNLKLAQYSCDRSAHAIQCILLKKGKEMELKRDPSFLSTFLFESGDIKIHTVKPAEEGKEISSLVFPGILMEIVSNGQFESLNHFLTIKNDKSENLMLFKTFSIPKPGSRINVGNEFISPIEYWQKCIPLL